MTQIKKIVSVRELEQVERLAREIWMEHYTPIIGANQVEYMLDKFQSVKAMQSQLDEGYQYYAVFDEMDIIGYFSFQVNASVLFLSKYYVDKKSRGKGVGRQCMDFISSYVKRKKLTKIKLTVNKHNKHTISVYERLGFEKLDEVVTDIGGGYVMDDYVMVMKCI